MPKKDKQNAQPETPEKEPQAAAAEEKELPPEDKKEEAKAETFTVTREQMEKMDQYLRLAAEYDNYRKRTAKEKEGIYANAKIDTIKGMLPVYDNLERGLAQFGAEDDDPHKKGLEMIFNQYKEALTRLGVTPIEAVGQKFDPNEQRSDACGRRKLRRKYRGRGPAAGLHARRQGPALRDRQGRQLKSQTNKIKIDLGGQNYV